MKSSKLVYVSITGLELKAFWNFPTFAYHAVRSKMQSDVAPGNISTSTRKIGSFHHTLTVWETKSHMIAFLRQGAHADAMKIFDSIATGKVYGYETDTIPTWEEARELWETKGHYIRRKGTGQVESNAIKSEL